MKQIPITKPYFDEKELNAVAEPIKSGWLVQGPKIKEFEEKFAQYSGIKFAVCSTSCTTALHMALITNGISAGDEVILPALTFVASANSIEYIGAKPVFVDIDLKTFNINPAKIEEKITKRTKAVMPVHLFGLCADMTPIMKIAKKYKLKVIEDAACAVGAHYYGKHAGAFGDAGCFSLHPRKLITCGEGGITITNNAAMYKHLKSLRDHGASMDDLLRHKQKVSHLPEYKILGYNYRLTDLQGAIALAQLEKLESIIKDRIKKAHYYDALLKDIKTIITPVTPKNYIHSFQSYVCIVDNKVLKTLKEKSKYRDKLMNYLNSRGISTRIGTHCVPNLHYYKKKYKFKQNDFTNAVKAEYLSMALPLYYALTKKEQQYIVQKIKEFIQA